MDGPGDALVSALVCDANAVVAALADVELDEAAAAAVALLALVAGQDVEPAEGSDGRDGRWRIARKVPRIGWSPLWTRSPAHPQVTQQPP